MKYNNVKGVLGLCTRHGQVRNTEELTKTIKEKNLANYDLSQYKDPHGDYIWYVFHNGELEDDIEDVAGWIVDNDDNRFW